MKIINFPSVLFQYRENSRAELLAWSICVVCAGASIVLCFRRVQNDLDRIQHVHLAQVSASQLADGCSCQSAPRQL